MHPFSLYCFNNIRKVPFLLYFFEVDNALISFTRLFHIQCKKFKTSFLNILFYSLTKFLLPLLMINKEYSMNLIGQPLLFLYNNIFFLVYYTILYKVTLWGEHTIFCYTILAMYNNSTGYCYMPCWKVPKRIISCN